LEFGWKQLLLQMGFPAAVGHAPGYQHDAEGVELIVTGQADDTIDWFPCEH